MKSIKTIVGIGLLMLGAIGFASCSQEEDNAVIQEKSNLLKIRTSVADSRGVITGTTFQQGDEIGICVTTVDGHDYTGNSQNIRAIYTGSDWRLEREVELREDEAIVYAYYPYNANATDSIDIYLNPTTTPEQIDYLQGSCQGVSINNTTANIRFNHALTRLTFAVTKGLNDVGEGVISRVRIENKLMYYMGQYVGEQPTKRDTKIATSGKMSIKTGEKRKITSEEDYFVEIPVNCTINTSKAQNIDILLLPVFYSSLQINVWHGGGIGVILTIDGKEYEFPLSANVNHGSEGSVISTYSWEAGQQYTYPIVVSRTENLVPDTSAGEAVYMGFDGENGKPLYWSTCNLGASSPEDDGGLYGWADPTGEKISENLDEYPSATPPADISGTEYDVARAMWGGNWRIPTSGELSDLDRNCTVEWITQNGVKGCLFTSNINGNTLFFPYSPSRNGTEIRWSEWDTVSGTFHQSSLYWSSTLNKDEPEHASCFYFDNDGNCWIARGGERCDGYSIRPVTNQP